MLKLTTVNDHHMTADEQLPMSKSRTQDRCSSYLVKALTVLLKHLLPGSLRIRLGLAQAGLQGCLVLLQRCQLALGSLVGAAVGAAGRLAVALGLHASACQALQGREVDCSVRRGGGVPDA